MAEKPPPDNHAATRGSLITLYAAAFFLLAIAAIVVLMVRQDEATGADTPPPPPTTVGADGFVALSAVGHAAAADATALRTDARRQLVEKTAGLYMVGELLDLRYALVEARLLARSDDFLGTFETGAARPAGGGLTALPARAIVNAHAVRAALKEIGRAENLRLVRFNDDEAPRIERVRLRTLALPAGVDTALLHEFAALRGVLAVAMTRPGSRARYELDLNAGAFFEPISLIAELLLTPLHEKFGHSCLGVNNRTDNEITLAWNAACNRQDILERIEKLPPAALLVAPQERKAALGR